MVRRHAVPGLEIANERRGVLGILAGAVEQEGGHVARAAALEERGAEPELEGLAVGLDPPLEGQDVCLDELVGGSGVEPRVVGCVGVAVVAEAVAIGVAPLLGVARCTSSDLVRHTAELSQHASRAKA